MNGTFYDYYIGSNAVEAQKELESWCDPISVSMGYEAVMVKDERGWHVLVTQNI